MERNYYMVRAGKSREEDLRVFFENQVVAVGWSNVNFSAEDSFSLRERIRRKYYSDRWMAPQVVSRKLNEAERFKNIRPGDYLVIPWGFGIALAEAGKKELYSGNARWLNLSNQREVVYRTGPEEEVARIPWDVLSKGLQKRIIMRENAILDLYEFKDEIEKIFNKSSSFFVSQRIQEGKERETEKFRQKILDRIQYEKKSYLIRKMELEKLVCELIQYEGYQTEILAKTTFERKINVDIRAMKSDFLSEDKIYIHIRHYSGVSDLYKVQQLIDVVSQEKYSGCKGYFITSAVLDENARSLAENNNIGVKDGNDLADLIMIYLDQLKETTKQALGICTELCIG